MNVCVRPRKTKVQKTLHGYSAQQVKAIVARQALCINDRGFGDYIIYTVNGKGFIEGWEKPVLNHGEWETYRDGGKKSKDGSQKSNRRQETRA